MNTVRMDGMSGLPLVPLTAARNPGRLLHQTKLPGQEDKKDDPKVSWVRAGYTKTGSAAEKGDCWQSCIACGEARSTKNVTRLKDHLLVCQPYLLSETAATVPDTHLQLRIERAKQAPPSGMSQSTLTVRSSNKRKLMRAYADELPRSEARQLRMLFAEMVYATNVPHSWVEHAAVQKFFTAIRPAFKLPTRHELSTPLLLGVYAVIATKVKLELKKHLWLTITSDGWARERGSMHVTNYQAAVPGASYFIDFDIATTEQVTGKSSQLRTACQAKAVVDIACLFKQLPPVLHYPSATASFCVLAAQRVADKTMEVVEKHGFEQKAAAYVTDTCAVMKAAWVILERKMPLLMCFGCQAHVWSLFMKDICDLSEVSCTPPNA